MKNRLNIIMLIIAATFYACNDEWEDEQYEKYVSFVRSGYNETYLNTNTADGIVHYKIPIEISGSTGNDRDVTVTVAIDPDTLIAYNTETFFKRTDLYYIQLDEQHYGFPNGMQVTIPAGEDVGYIAVDFSVNNLDLVEKYILPLKIESTSEYMPSPKKYYRRSLMRIIPFNDFSGVYSAQAGMIRGKLNDGGDTPTTAATTREMRFVSSNTVFFYAGVCEETATDRARYKVKATFVPSPSDPDNGDIVLEADDPEIHFSYRPNDCKYFIKKEMDVLQPYLQIRTITMNLKYQYDDISNPSYTVTYQFGMGASDTGFYTLERRRNIQIPEEDQQEIFEW